MCMYKTILYSQLGRLSICSMLSQLSQHNGVLGVISVYEPISTTDKGIAFKGFGSLGNSTQATLGS